MVAVPVVPAAESSQGPGPWLCKPDSSAFKLPAGWDCAAEALACEAEIASAALHAAIYAAIGSA